MASLLTKIRILRHLPYVFLSLHTGKKIALSFDITDFCNLRCPYCYWWENRRGEELSIVHITSLAKFYRKQGVVIAVWVGGEPTLRPDVLKAVTPIFPVNWIVTNGTDAYKSKDPTFNPFTLPNAWLIVSLDGIGDAHDKSRGRKGLYESLKNKFWNKPILTTTTLHQGNRHEPARLLKEWSKSKILGMTFEFAIVVGRRPDPDIDLIGKERDKVIDELLELKKIYGRFLTVSDRSLRMMKSDRMHLWADPSRCTCVSCSVSLDA